jgi:ABC-type nitrate/sulfonate/bicarbonate transport system permease component
MSATPTALDAPGGDTGIEEGLDQVRVPFTERKLGIWTIRIITLALFLAIWEAYGRSQNPALFAPFSRVVEAFYENGVQTADIWRAALDSLQAMLIGFALAIPVGLVVGLLMGRFRVVEYMLDPYVSFVYALPIVVLVPLMVIWLGIGTPVRILIVFITTVFPIIINTMVGAKQVDRKLVEVATIACASERQILRTVFVPFVLPYVFTGIHVAIGTALIGMLLGEMLVVLRGLGGMIVSASNSYQPEMVMAPLLVIVFESLFLVWLMGWIRRKLMPWSKPDGAVRR